MFPNTQSILRSPLQTVLPRCFATFPPPAAGNPWQFLLLRELEQLGWEREELTLRLKEIRRARKTIPILWFHWPESIWRRPSKPAAVLRASRFWLQTTCARKMGLKLVWSAHNVLPHYTNWSNLERILRREILRTFDLVIAHAPSALDDLHREFSTTGRREVVAPLGHYEDWYRPTMSRQRARLQFGVKDNQRVLIAIGSSYKKEEALEREGHYKGMDLLADAWSSTDHPILHLVITGHCSKRVMATLRHTGRTTLLNRVLSDEELANLLLAADAVVLPYRKITTSAAFFLALTFSLPVIAPALPFFMALCKPTTALLYDSATPVDGLSAALAKFGRGLWSCDSTALAMLKQQYSWRRSAEVIGSAFEELLCPGRRAC